MKPPFVVAEIGGNHMGDLDTALLLIDEAKAAGADAVKFQCFTPEQMAAPGSVIEAGPWAGRELLDLYRETHTPRAWFKALFDFAHSIGIVPFSSVFHPDDVDFLETLGCPFYKIASFELTDLPLIRYAARTRKPIILSTGMATQQEIEWAALAATTPWHRATLLKCTSAYPAPLAEANLATMHVYRTACGADYGLSDHTLGTTAAVVATAAGATMIEKHLIAARSDGGPDAAFSAEPHEFAAMVKACRDAAAAVGDVRYGPTESEMVHLGLRRPPGGMRGTSPREALDAQKEKP